RIEIDPGAELDPTEEGGEDGDQLERVVIKSRPARKRRRRHKRSRGQQADDAGQQDDPGDAVAGKVRVHGWGLVRGPWSLVRRIGHGPRTTDHGRVITKYPAWRP